jgi:hypothetical protein
MIEVPEEMQNYFDYKSYGEDMLESIHVTESVYMFTNY